MVKRKTKGQTFPGKPVNIYAGECSRCNAWVHERAGFLGHKKDGQWTVIHGKCPTLKKVSASMSEENLEDLKLEAKLELFLCKHFKCKPEEIDEHIRKEIEGNK